MGPTGVGQGVGAGGRVRAFAAAGAVALLAFVGLGLGATHASAVPLTMTFTEARANVGVQLADAALFQPPSAAPFTAEIDPSGTITGGTLTVPRFTTLVPDVGVEGTDVDVDFEIGTITGGFDPATGTLTLSGTAGGVLTATDRVTAEATRCAVAAVGEGGSEQLTLSTAGANGTRVGAPFAFGLTGAGAIAGQWEDMTAELLPGEDTPAVCNTVADRIGGPGGIWLEHDGDTVAPAAPLLAGTDPVSPARSGAPRILGTAEPGSTVRVYSGGGCTGAPVATAGAAELTAPGIAVAVAEGVTASFSATATDAAGNSSQCSFAILYSRLPQPPPSLDPPRTSRPCVVPKLKGRTLAQARRALRAARCRVGKVRKPTAKRLQRLTGKRRPVLVVKSFSPRRGARPASRKVTLRVGPRPRALLRRG